MDSPSPSWYEPPDDIEPEPEPFIVCFFCGRPKGTDLGFVIACACPPEDE